MRYFPNLIPKEHRVLPDYFRGNTYASGRKKNKLSTFLSYIGSITFFALGLLFLPHPVTMLLFGFMGFIILPWGHHFLERLLRFDFTRRIKSGLAVGLAVCAIPLLIHDNAIDRGRHELRQHQIAVEQQIQQREQAQEQQQKAVEMQRLAMQADSFSKYLKKSDDLKNGHEPQQALDALQQARSFATSVSDNDQIRQELAAINLLNVENLIAHGKYKQAIPDLDKCLQEDPINDDLLCKRAVCYSKTGRTREAVADLKVAIQKGSAEASRLYERINPIRKRVLYYLTRCCDGSPSPSNAKGRGACSHHGGVCDWNEPVYEEYRQYE